MLVFGLSAAPACRRAPQDSTQAAAGQAVAMRTVTVPVNGMVCQVCAGTVKRALKNVEGVQDAEISLEKRSAVIHYDERRIRVEQLTRAIADAGYKPLAPTPVEPPQ